MGIFISYDGYMNLFSGTADAASAVDAGSDASAGQGGAGAATGIQCYEFVMPDPVKNFALSFAKEKFPIGRGEIVNNTERFRLSSLWEKVKSFDERSMQTRGVLYPYWENAARCVEDRAALLLVAAIAALILPVVTVLVLAVRYAVRGKRRLEDDLLPAWKDSAEEAIRVRQRARWEKRHGKGRHET